jgi:hypothetical protein
MSPVSKSSPFSVASDNTQPCDMRMFTIYCHLLLAHDVILALSGFAHHYFSLRTCLSHNTLQIDYNNPPSLSFIPHPFNPPHSGVYNLDLITEYIDIQLLNHLDRSTVLSQKVAGSIRGGAVGIFHSLNPSGRTMSLGRISLIQN